MKEEWKDIEGYYRLYQVSDLGRVKSLKRPIDRGQRGIIIKEESIIKPQNKKGYLQVGLRKSGQSQKYFSVHRLVAKAFIENPKNKKTVNHKNFIKTDNRKDNLEWLTYKEQISHAIDNNVFNQKGSKNVKAKLKEEDVIDIREVYSSKSANIQSICKIYNISKSTVYRIISRKSWPHI